MDKNKIALLTTVANFQLYEKTAPFFPKDIKKYVFDGRSGMYGIDSLCFAFKKFKDFDIDWLILSDEDVIFNKPDVIYDIISSMDKEDYTVCGIRDGGVISHREFNPYVVNTFFCVLNFKKILKIWNKKEMLKNQFTLNDEFKEVLTFLKYSYNTTSLYEPYYCFYLWLLRKKQKTLFLESKMEIDTISNQLHFNGENFATHTWHARGYGINEKHTDRINNYLDNLKEIPKIKLNYKIFKNRTFKIEKTIKIIVKKMRNKINFKG